MTQRKIFIAFFLLFFASTVLAQSTPAPVSSDDHTQPANTPAKAAPDNDMPPGATDNTAPASTKKARKQKKASDGSGAGTTPKKKKNNSEKSAKKKKQEAETGSTSTMPTAVCEDGAYSFQKPDGRQKNQACKGHGGVSRFL